MSHRSDMIQLTDKRTGTWVGRFASGKGAALLEKRSQRGQYAAPSVGRGLWRSLFRVSCGPGPSLLQHFWTLLGSVC